MSSKREIDQLDQRESWGSRLGYIFSTLGMAVGVGAVWRFPMMTAQYGGGAFVFAFIVLSLIIVIPAGWAESALGRRYRKSVVGTLGEVAGVKGKFFGYFMSIVPIGLMAYYPIILATVVIYVYYTINGSPFLEDVTGFYDRVNNSKLVIFSLVMVLNSITAYISSKGIKRGVERVCKIMLPLMILFTFIVAIRVVTLEGISVGIEFYLKPDFSMLKDLKMWSAAAGMALFAVGLGPGFLLTYGSYMDKDADLATDFLTVNLVQLLVCLLCGLAIIPAIILFGLNPAEGKGVLFQSLPLVFSEIPGRMIWFGIFMVGLFFSGLSSTLAQVEIPVSSFTENLNLSRNKSIAIVLIASTLLSVPCIWSDAFFKFFDILIGNVFYCIAATGLACYLAWVIGAKKIREEWYNPTSAIKYGSWVDALYKFIAVPVLIYFTLEAIKSLF